MSLAGLWEEVYFGQETKHMMPR